MMGALVLLAWLFLVAGIIWFVALAKDYVSLTGNETRFLWKLHKRQAQCSCTKFETIRHKKKVVGFRCACGYEYLSKRLITQRDRRSKLLGELRENERARMLEPVYLDRSDDEA